MLHPLPLSFIVQITQISYAPVLPPAGRLYTYRRKQVWWASTSQKKKKSFLTQSQQTKMVAVVTWSISCWGVTMALAVGCCKHPTESPRTKHQLPVKDVYSSPDCQLGWRPLHCWWNMTHTCKTPVRVLKQMSLRQLGCLVSMQRPAKAPPAAPEQSGSKRVENLPLITCKMDQTTGETFARCIMTQQLPETNKHTPWQTEEKTTDLCTQLIHFSSLCLQTLTLVSIFPVISHLTSIRLTCSVQQKHQSQPPKYGSITAFV